MGFIRTLGVALSFVVMGSVVNTPAVALTDEEVSVLAGSCANCHGPDGRSPGPIASLAGRPEALLRAQLRDFKAGKVPNTTVMTRLSTGYSDEQLDALARYFSRLTPKGAK
ncbi:MAG TPA: c-type cytochrome [Xanthobacteraceae bacterium]|nr:c-type cytochrome [Xanthobacteraceae bacterium]